MRARYKVVFTPVGWQVVDTVEVGDPVAEYGLGDDEYARAKAFASMRNLDAQANAPLPNSHPEGCRPFGRHFDSEAEGSQESPS